VAAEEMAWGHGDDDIAEAVTDHLLTYGPGALTLRELREIAAEARAAAISAARSAPAFAASDGTRH
jgi:hypothetical protein